MPLLGILAKERAAYYHSLFVYKQRREVVRQKFDFKEGSGKIDYDYNRAVRKLNYKIRYWQKRINVIDKKREVLRKLSIAITEFSGYNLRRNYDTGYMIKIARGFYYKYGIENGMRPLYLRDHISESNNRMHTKYRKWVTNEIVTKPEVRKMWENFKQLMKNN